MSSLEMVKEFHEVFNHPVTKSPLVSNIPLCKLRHSLIEEELGELMTAMAAWDEVGTFDALCDLQYVLDGAFLSLGYYRMKDDGMAEVHRSNMSKLGEDGKPIRRDDGKIMKGPNFSKPDLEGVLAKWKPKPTFIAKPVKKNKRR